MCGADGIFPTFGSPFEIVHIVVCEHSFVFAKIFGNGGQISLVSPYQRIGSAGNAYQTIVALGDAEAEGVGVDVAITVGSEHKLRFVECRGVMFEHIFLNLKRRHFATVEVRCVPFAPFAKSADVDIFDSRVAVVFLCQCGGKIFGCLNVNRIVPNRHGGS